MFKRKARHEKEPGDDGKSTNVNEYKRQFFFFFFFFYIYL